MSRILGIGGVAYDMLAMIPHLPAWEEIEYIQEYQVQQGGMVATAMVAAAKLGGNTEYFGAVGDDLQGKFLLENFKINKVLHDRTLVINGGDSAFTIVLIHKGTGRRSFIHNKGIQIRSELTMDEIDLSGVSHVLFDGFYFNTAFRTAKKIRETGGIVSITDISPRNREKQLRDFLELIDYPILSELFVRPYTNISNALEAGKSLFSKKNKALLITCGDKGVHIITNEGTVFVPSFQVKLVDSTGAGDVFHGAFCFGMWKGYGLKEAAVFASAVAALKCTKIGGQKGIPNFQETRDFILQRSPECRDWLV